MKFFLRSLLLVGTATLCSAASAQEFSPTLLEEVRDYVEVPDAAWMRLDLPATAGAPFLLPIEIEGALVHVEMRPHSLRSDNFSLYVQHKDGVVHEEDAPAPLTYRGSVYEMPEAVVATSLSDNGLDGFLALPNGETYGFQPFRSVDAEADRDLHVIYHNSQIQGTPAECGTEDSILSVPEQFQDPQT
ncbi:MAG: hypothetical protein ACI841_001572 [Planctomycetota bacterium]|jgi:hypothetical protein